MQRRNASTAEPALFMILNSHVPHSNIPPLPHAIRMNGLMRAPASTTLPNVNTGTVLESTASNKAVSSLNHSGTPLISDHRDLELLCIVVTASIDTAVRCLDCWDSKNSTNGRPS